MHPDMQEILYFSQFSAHLARRFGLTQLHKLFDSSSIKQSESLRITHLML